MNEKLKEIQKLIDEKGDYELVAQTMDLSEIIPGCVVVSRSDLYEVFKNYHHHECYEIIYVIDGKISFFVEEKKYELTNGDMVFVAPNLLHKLIFEKQLECKRVIINFVDEYVKKYTTKNTEILNIFKLINEKGMHKVSFFPEKRKRLEKLFELMEKLNFSEKFGDDLRFDISFAEMMLLVNKVYMNLPEEDLIQKNINDPYVIKIMEFINKNIEKKILLNDIAEHLSLSISRISHLFKSVTGISIMSYIIKKRLATAKELLKNGEHIKSVYIKCGFPDEASFFRYFKQEYNITPKKYALSFIHD